MYGMYTVPVLDDDFQLAKRESKMVSLGLDPFCLVLYAGVVLVFRKLRSSKVDLRIVLVDC